MSTTRAKKERLPKDVILREKDTSAYKDHTIYAEALAQVIASAATPLMIGIFSPWGTGKTSILKQVRSLLMIWQGQNDLASFKIIKPQSRRRLWATVAFFVALSLFFVTWSVLINIPELIAESHVVGTQVTSNSTVASPNSSLNSWQLSCVVTLAVFAFALTTLLLVVCFCSGNGKPFLANLKLLLIAAFTQPPKKPVGKRRNDEDLPQESEVVYPKQARYIFVNFNAWAFAGTDSLWAGIVCNISNAIEKEFGLVTARLFRITSPRCEQCDVDNEYPYTNRIFAKLGSDAQMVKDILDGHGLVLLYERYEAWLQNGRSVYQSEQTIYSEWWVVEYSSYVEAQSAVDQLQKDSIESSFVNPFENHLSSSETQPLLHDLEEKHTVSTDVSFWSLLAKYPKMTCGVPTFFCNLLIIFMIVIPIPLVLSASMLSHTLPVLVQVLAWIPATIALVYSVVKLTWAMFNSQETRIASALKGAQGDVGAKLGFMNKIKYEVKVINQLIKYAEVSHQVIYKIVLQIDDLDKIPLQWIKNIFQAIEILMSKGRSPYICLVAVDPSVVVKSIEQAMSNTGGGITVSGYHYVKKVFNLSVCLPQVTRDSIEQSVAIVKARYHERNYQGLARIFSEVVKGTHYINALVKETEKTSKLVDILTMRPGKLPAQQIPVVLSQAQFLNECRKFLKKSKIATEYLLRNPSNIKRVFNVISFTTLFIGCMRKENKKRHYLESLTTRQSQSDSATNFAGGNPNKELFTHDWAHCIVFWIILTEQWPYRMSYILQAVQESDELVRAGNNAQAIPNSETIFEIYRNRVLPQIQSQSKTSNVQSLLDEDPRFLEMFLKTVSKKEERNYCLNKEKLNILCECTTNMDYTLLTGKVVTPTGLQAAPADAI